jgi:hypothetical protein
MSDDDPDALELLLQYLYTGSTDVIANKIQHQDLPQGSLVLLPKVSCLADKYGITACANWLYSLLRGRYLACDDCSLLSQDPPKSVCVDLHHHPDQVIQVLHWLWKEEIPDEGEYQEVRRSMLSNFWQAMGGTTHPKKAGCMWTFSPTVMGPWQGAYDPGAHRDQKLQRQMDVVEGIFQEHPNFALAITKIAFNILHQKMVEGSN